MTKHIALILTILFTTSLLVPLNTAAQDYAIPTIAPGESKEEYRNRMRQWKRDSGYIEQYKREAREVKQQVLDDNQDLRNKEGAAELEQKMETARDEFNQQWKERVQARVNNRINQYERVKDRHSQAYSRINMRLTDLVSKLEDRGCDVSSVRPNLTRLEELIDEFTAAHREFMASFQDSRSLIQDGDKDAFIAQVRAAKSEVPEIRQNAQTVKTYIQSTIKPQLRTVAQTCQQEQERGLTDE